MRSAAELYETAKDEPAFSNSTEWEVWSYNWCEECTKHSPELWDQGVGCPLIIIALNGRTPLEWAPDPDGGSFVCSEFERRDDGDGDDPNPTPTPSPPAEEMPGQTDIFTFFAEEAIDALNVAPEPAHV